MKRFLLCFLLCLLLTACGTSRSGPALTGTWVNAGQYSEGHDFVETLTLAEDGTLTVHLEYRGSDYATLNGTWTESDGVLNVDFADPDTKDRSYRYTVTETALVLTGDGKDVTYTRKE